MSMVRTAWIKTFLIALCGFPFLAGTQWASATDRQDQIEVIESQLASEKKKLEEMDTREKDLLGMISRLEEEASQKRREIVELEKRIESTEKEVRTLQARLSEMEKQSEAVKSQIAERLVSLYKYARRGYFNVLANAEDLHEFWKRTRYIKAIVKADRAFIESLGKEAQGYRERIARIGSAVEDKQAERREEEEELASLRAGLEEKTLRLMKVHKEKEYYQTLVKELQVAAQNLKRTLLHIEENDSFELPSAERFAELKGRLPLPLEGELILGDKLSGLAGRSLENGVFIKGDSEERVKAVFPGRVDFSGKLKGYGEVVIINHGGRFFTVSALLSRRAKYEGEDVQGGEVIGTAGVTGYSKTPGLYFEIRKGEENLDVLSWVKGG